MAGRKSFFGSLLAAWNAATQAPEDVEIETGALKVCEVGPGGTSTLAFLDPTGSTGINFGSSGNTAQCLTSANGWRYVTLSLSDASLLGNEVCVVAYSSTVNDNATVQTQAAQGVSAKATPGTTSALNAKVLSKTQPSVTIGSDDPTALIKTVGATFSGSADIANLLVIVDEVA